jgi:hypothetical protein
MDTTNTHPSINRTLAVINGGLNLKVDVQKLQRFLSRNCSTKCARLYTRGITVPRQKKATFIGFKRFIFFTINGIRRDG